jgi:hypothetical protein
MTPCLAARDTPAMIAAGAARMSGHDVATTSTASARIGLPLLRAFFTHLKLLCADDRQAFEAEGRSGKR